MVITSRNKVLILTVLFALIAPALATSVGITIWGEDKTGADKNATAYGGNNTIEVQAWNTSRVKNFTVNSANASGDVINFNISNITAYQVQELKVNGTSVNGYQAGGNGMLNFTYNVTGNKTFVLAPATNIGGYNATWMWAWNQPGLFRNQTGVTRALGTVYQNVGGTVEFHDIVITHTSDCMIDLIANTTNPPTAPPSGSIAKTQNNIAGTVYQRISGFILPGYYFQTYSQGTCTSQVVYQWVITK